MKTGYESGGWLGIRMIVIGGLRVNHSDGEEWSAQEQLGRVENEQGTQWIHHIRARSGSGKYLLYSVYSYILYDIQSKPIFPNIYLQVRVVLITR